MKHIIYDAVTEISTVIEVPDEELQEESPPPQPTDIEILQIESQKLKERLASTEQIAAETSITQQQLI